MKKMQTLLLMMISLIILGCEDEPIPSDIETTIYDPTNDIPIENFKVKIREYRTQGTLAGTNYNFKGYIDSTITDLDGIYSLTFQTSGNGNKYKLGLENKKDIYIPNLEEFINKNSIGNQEEINFQALKLFPVDLRIRKIDNIANQIFIYTQFAGIQLDPIEPQTQNAIRRIWIDKNIINEINFRIEATSPYQDYYVNLPLTENTEIYEYDIEISSTNF